MLFAPIAGPYNALHMKVLVLAVPCLRVSYLGCYGCDWVSTPHLDRLAAEGVVFDQHFADSLSPRRRFHDLNDAEPNHAWWTGRYFFPTNHAMSDDTSAPPLPALLAAHGIEMGHIVSRSRLADAAGTASLAFPRKRLLAALPDHAKSTQLLAWVDLPSLAPPWPALRKKRLRSYFPREQTAEEEVLTPWLNPPFGIVDSEEDMAVERLQATYAAMLSYFDAQLGKLFQELRARSWFDDVLLIVTSDRGLGLGEHGFVGTVSPELHEEFIHIPLVMRLPGGAEAGRRVSALTQAVDLFPTLLEALGLQAAEAHGHSLLPLARGERDSVREYACAGLATEAGMAYTLRTPEWSFVLPTQTRTCSPQLYVKPDDRWEVNNVLQHHLELAQRLEQTLHDFISATRQLGPLQPPALDK